MMNHTEHAASACSLETQLWTNSEVQRHQILGGKLSQKRTGPESLMAEYQGRHRLNDSYKRMEEQLSEHQWMDDRTMATWGGSTPCQLEEDG
ncbi:pericentriolar material 1 protein-like [Coregonus clupeaformis]|uniref:Uncharacterized protein n=1 Tax=Coregonus suidteri TaxID=861788 RepID=A0AAN8KZL8_9TELE|nr:pericentriolar material 1 protein-like [Coregonus clupeaformis]